MNAVYLGASYPSYTRFEILKNIDEKHLEHCTRYAVYVVLMIYTRINICMHTYILSKGSGVHAKASRETAQL